MNQLDDVAAIDWQRRALAAEKTVEVLKRKVKALYNGESTSAFREQLERARARQLQARQRSELMEVRAAELRRYSDGLERDVADRTRSLRVILDNVTTGFLVVGRDLIVHPGHTRSCHQLFAAEVVAGRPLHELTRETDVDAQAWLALAAEQIFEDVIPAEVGVDQLPKSCVVDQRTLGLDARVIRDATGAVEALLLTITDLTSLQDAQAETRNVRSLIGILHQREAFRGFVAETRALLSNARASLQTGGGAPGFLRRAIHTIKGNAAAYDLEGMVATIHEIEGQPAIDLVCLDRIEDELRRFFSRNGKLLAMDYEGSWEESFAVAEPRVAALQALVTAHGDGLGDIERWAAQVVLKRADELLGPVAQFVSKLAERLGKSARFSLRGGEILVDVQRVRPLLSNLVHLLRNAVDHGVEPANQRGSKPRVGSVDLVIEEHPRQWCIVLSDDGRGIDPVRVAERAIERGLLAEEELARFSDADKLELIFRDGLSTAAKASEISGRGVGMGAVRAAVQQGGGTMSVDTQPGRGTTVTMMVPKPAALCDDGHAPAAE